MRTVYQHRKYSVWVLMSLIIGMFFVGVLKSEAASPAGQSGWYVPISLVTGNDTLCSSNEIRMTLGLFERGTENKYYGVDSIIFAVVENDGSISSYVEGTGTTLLDGICVNPDTQGIAIDIAGGASHYDFRAVHSFLQPADIERGRVVRTDVYLTPVSYPIAEYEKVAPLTAVSSTSPDYIFDINYIPTDLSLPSVNNFRHRVAEIVSSTTPVVVDVDAPLTGGVGRHTVAATVLPDGVYSWYGDITANGPLVYDGFGYLAKDRPKSGLLYDSELFIVDSTAPSTTISHFPNQPSDLQTVTLRADAQDTLAGVSKIEIYLDTVRVRTCLFANKNTATCVYTGGPFSGGGLHDYQIVTYDAAGNTTNASNNFIIATAAPVFPDTCAAPLATIRDSVSASIGGGATALDVLVRSNNLIYAGASGAENGLVIFDISDPDNVVQRSSFSTDNPISVRNNWWGNDVVGLTVDGTYAYLATLYGGLVIVNVSNPDSPTFVSKLALHNQNPPDTKETWEIKVVGNYAFIAGGLGMFVVDVTNKANPTLVANLDLGALRATDIVISGNYAYLALGRYGFTVVDITDPTNPVEVAAVPDIYSPLILAYSVAVKDEYLYVSAHFTNKIRVYNITNPASPVYLTSVDAAADTGGAPRSLTVEGKTLYASAGTGGVYVFDVSNPSVPTLLYRLSPEDFGGEVDIWGTVTMNSNFKDLVIVSKTPSPTLYTSSLECTPMADLEADLPTVSESSVMQGDTVTLRTGDIKNRGTDVAIPHNYGGFYIDFDGDDISDLEVPISRVVNTIDPGVDFELSVDWVVPTMVPPGTNHRIRYEVDRDFEVEVEASVLRGNNDSGWSAPFTILALTQVGSITTTDCEIAAGNGSCDVIVDWQAKNFTGNASVRQSGVEFSADTESLGTVRPVTPNNRIFVLTDTGSGFSVAAAATVTCAPGSTWDGSLCAPPPPACPAGQFFHTELAVCIDDPVVELYQDGSIVLAEMLMRRSSSTVLTYSVDAPFAVECTIFDGSIPAFSFSHDGLVPVTTGTYETRPLESAQVIRISCTAPGLPVPEEVEFRINVVPQVVES
jgi:hypothetical protein